MTQEKSGLGEQALNQIAKVALTTQLEAAERLEVQVKTDPSKLAQGELESLSINGDGLMMQEDLRMEQMEMQINSIAVNPWKALMGKIQLTHPAEGSTRIVLSETDINRALNSELFIDSLRNLTLYIDGKPMTVDPQQVDCHLLADGKVALEADILIQPIGETKAIAFTTLPRVRLGDQEVTLEDVHYTRGKELSPELTRILVDKIHEILNLRNFEMEGISLHIHHLAVEAGKLTLQAEAYVKQFPSA